MSQRKRQKRDDFFEEENDEDVAFMDGDSDVEGDSEQEEEDLETAEEKRLRLGKFRDKTLRYPPIFCVFSYIQIKKARVLSSYVVLFVQPRSTWTGYRKFMPIMMRTSQSI